ncbi:MAG: hypothetical protein Q8L05_02615 [Actinomycetota bacterium]|nr:hypothetical protein [Actinomycetota bacterium]MDP2287738.1 hypothetical protein [Actinomycetota bacterium]
MGAIKQDVQHELRVARLVVAVPVLVMVTAYLINALMVATGQV